MAVRSGRYRHRFELLRNKVGDDGEPDRNEYGEFTGEYEIIQRPWCDVLLTADSENASTAVNSQEQITFEIRYSKMFTNPTNNMFIRFEGNIYDITSVDDPQRRREKLNIFAIKRR